MHHYSLPYSLLQHREHKHNMAPDSFLLRQLGKDGPMLPAVSFGCMNMSLPFYGTIEGDEERFKVLDRAVELGATFWDSAE